MTNPQQVNLLDDLGALTAEAVNLARQGRIKSGADIQSWLQGLGAPPELVGALGPVVMGTVQKVLAEAQTEEVEAPAPTPRSIATPPARRPVMRVQSEESESGLVPARGAPAPEVTFQQHLDNVGDELAALLADTFPAVGLQILLVPKGVRFKQGKQMVHGPVFVITPTVHTERPLGERVSNDEFIGESLGETIEGVLKHVEDLASGGEEDDE